MDKPFFTGHLWESFRRVYGPILTFLSLLIAFLSYFYLPTQVVSLKLVIICGIVILIILITLSDASFRAYSMAFNILPRVLMGKSAKESTAKALLLLERSILFSFETLVSIYIVENDYEELLGVGYVCNIQDDHKIQVLVTKSLNESLDSVWQEITNNNGNTLKKLRVKPHVPKMILEAGR